MISVEPGQRVYFSILGEPDKRYEATHRTIEPATDSISSSSSNTGSSSGSSSSSSTISATAIYYNGLFDVPNPDSKLRISMTATVHIVRGEAKGVLAMPAGALGARRPDGRYPVRIMGTDGRVEERLVTIGLRTSVTAQVEDGLREGEQAIVGSAAASADSGTQQRMSPPPRL